MFVTTEFRNASTLARFSTFRYIGEACPRSLKSDVDQAFHSKAQGGIAERIEWLLKV